MLIRGGMILQGGTRFRADLRVENGIITETAPGLCPSSGEQVLDASGHLVTPGFLDIHTHGGANVDVNSATEQGLEAISCLFAAHGTTGWQCSVLSDTEAQTLRCVEQIRRYLEQPHPGAELLGIHLEGPFLSQEYRGSMPGAFLRDRMDLGLVERYQKAAGGHIRYITLAPELPGVLEAIPALKEMGIAVAIGHSGADYETAMAAFQAGAVAATHTMNAMRLIHQHQPGITGAALESDACCEIICDGIHLHPGTVRLILKAKGLDRVVAITDSIMAAGLPDGNYRLGANQVTVSGGDAKVAGTDIRAGSTLTMDRALQNLKVFTGEPPEKLLPLLTANPAKLLGLYDRGELAEGTRGDMVLLNQKLEPCVTLVKGQVQCRNTEAQL